MFSEEEILGEYIRRFGGQIFESLEDLLVSPEGFGLETATPLQRAICRIATGEWLDNFTRTDRTEIATALGLAECPADLPRPQRLMIRAGIRTFKSLFTAVASVWASQTCDVRMLGAGEIPRFSIVSLKIDLAQVIMRHLVGNIQANPILRSLLLEDPTADTLLLRMPSGRPFEIKVVAGSRAGASLVARYSGGVIFDEAPRMVGAADGVVNLEDLRSAVMGRLLPGAQIFEIGSPWQPYGPFYEADAAHFGKPSEECIVVFGQGDWLNPYWWTEERAEELKRNDPMAYRTDFLAQYASPEESAFPQQVLEKITREGPLYLPREVGYEYAAAIDPATRGNAFTLVIGARLARAYTDEEGQEQWRWTKTIVRAQQWQGTPTQPISPRRLFAEHIKPVLAAYGLDWCYTDQWSADALVDVAEEFGIDLLVENWTKGEYKRLLGNLAAEAAAGDVELPPDPVVRKDFVMVKKKPTAGGDDVKYVLPHTPDGRHCDYVPPTARCFGQWLGEYTPPPPATREAQIDKEAHERKLRAAEGPNTPWWEQGFEDESWITRELDG